jgi:hypothetical protein
MSVDEARCQGCLKIRIEETTQHFLNKFVSMMIFYVEVRKIWQIP